MHEQRRLELLCLDDRELDVLLDEALAEAKIAAHDGDVTRSDKAYMVAVACLSEIALRKYERGH